jgi:hypothetical protein
MAEPAPVAASRDALSQRAAQRPEGQQESQEERVFPRRARSLRASRAAPAQPEAQWTWQQAAQLQAWPLSAAEQLQGAQAAPDAPRLPSAA